MKTFLPKSASLTIVFFIANLFCVSTAFGQATITTDQPDYAPGSTCTITGSGFLPGETVTLQVMHADETPNDGEEHFHWDVIADENGNFITTWHVCEDDCLGSTLKATADGETSGLHAEVVFTDSGAFSYSGSTNNLSMVANSTSNLSIDVTAPKGNGSFNVSLSFAAQNGTTIGIGAGTNQINLTSETKAFITTSGSSGEGDTETFPITVSVGSSVPAGTYQFQVSAIESSGSISDGSVWKFDVQVGSIGTKIKSVTVGSQTGSVECSIVGTVTYSVSAIREASGTVNGVYSVLGLPTGVSSSFSTSSFVSAGNETFPNTILTLGIPNSLSEGSYSFDIVLSDGSDQSTSEGILLVSDNVAPVADVLSLADATGECSAEITAAPTATDACSGVITGTTTDSLIRSTQGTSVVTWTFDDGNGNKSTQAQKIVVKDETAPVADALSLADATGECSVEITAAPTATDACSGVITGTTTDPLIRSTQGTSVVTWTFDDGNGNKSTQNQKIVVKDETKPTISELPATVFVNNDAGVCSAEVVLTAPQTEDNCGVESIVNDHPSTTYPVGTTNVIWTITDINGNTNTATQTVTINNITPIITSVTPSSFVPVPIDTATSLTIAYSDNNVTTAIIDWDDNIIETFSSTANPIILSHNYSSPGVYSVAITLKDACDAVSLSYLYQFIVIYDPNGGFVTGGGWINSPVGAYRADQSLTGKANFGFVSKYKKGSNIPEGSTEFQFQAGKLNFNSSSYEEARLVIAGAKASYKGVGTINGNGNYSFLVSAVDGQVTGGGGIDKFRIKIWDTNDENNVVYDNNIVDTAEDALPATSVGGGSIVIHEIKKKVTTKVITLAEKTVEPILFDIKVYPNPSKQYFTLELEGASNEKVEVVVYDVLGRLVKHIEKNDAQPLSFGEDFPNGVYIVITSQGVNRKTQRLVKE